MRRRWTDGKAVPICQVRSADFRDGRFPHLYEISPCGGGNGNTRARECSDDDAFGANITHTHSTGGYLANAVILRSLFTSVAERGRAEAAAAAGRTMLTMHTHMYTFSEG